MEETWDVERCRRRPNCRRRLVYLDTSTFGDLTDENERATGLCKVLREEIEAERVACVGSPWHDDEVSMLALPDKHVKTLRTYTLDLRMRYDSELITNELWAAAREFSGEAEDISWEEAFRDDPDDPPLSPFQAEYLNNREDRFEHPPAARDDVEHDRSTSASLMQAHTELRELDLSWENVALANVDAQVAYLLGPLADPHYAARARAKTEQLARHLSLHSGVDLDAGSPLRRYMRFGEVGAVARRLAEQFAAVRAAPDAFAQSDAVRHLPMIRLFCLLLTTLSVDGKQTRPRQSDLHDLWHLTYGLSRCDVVTADKTMCRLVRQRSLVPTGVTLIESTHFDEIAEAVRAP